MSGQHALFAPSAGPQWGYCSGSILANQAVPDQETQSTREGDAAHWVVAECLVAWRDGHGGDLGLPAFYLGKTAPNGVVIDGEITDSAEVMVNDVLDVCQQHGALRDLLVEYRVHMPRVHKTECWGRLDVGLDLRRIGLVYEWDFKHGHGRVDAFENFQLSLYALGLRNLWGETEVDNAQLEAHLRVVQPRCYRSSGPVDEWVTDFSALVWIGNKLAAQAHEAENSPRMRAGKHCRYCPARGQHCAAAKRAGYRWVDYAKAPYEIETMDDSDLATERTLVLEGLVLLKARLGALEDDLQQRVSDGATGTGLALEAGRGNLNWTVPPAQAAAFAAQLGVDISKEAVLTPTQAIAKTPVDKRPLLKQALKAVAKRDATGLKLVPAGDSRTARAFQRRK